MRQYWYIKDNQRKGVIIMTSKKQTLKVYFETMCDDMYEAEFEAYKQAVKESDRTILTADNTFSEVGCELMQHA